MASCICSFVRLPYALVCILLTVRDAHSSIDARLFPCICMDVGIATCILVHQIYYLSIFDFVLRHCGYENV